MSTKHLPVDCFIVNNANHKRYKVNASDRSHLIGYELLPDSTISPHRIIMTKKGVSRIHNPIQEPVVSEPIRITLAEALRSSTITTTTALSGFTTIGG